MQNFTMNCIFNADSTNADGVYVGSFNANYDHGNIYYNMNVIDAIANQSEVANDFEEFKVEVFNRIKTLTDAGFIVNTPAVAPAPIIPPVEEEEDEE
jgi:hypothetical protein